MVKKKIVLFGGTFDPVHLGHTAVAAAAAERIGAEKVIFIPAKRSPLKTSFPEAGDSDRLAMIALAIADNEKFQLNDYELRKPLPCYTLETVRHFHAECGDKALIYWLMGADSICELSRWYGIVELIDECNLCVMFRAGCEPPDFAKFKDVWGAARIEKLQRNVIRTPLIDISSTEVRRKLTAGQDVTGMLEPQVADYIREHGLYQSGAKD
ncbi:MAG: nicotinate (nicotinamide) nucleotide adenylyltransferase [Phycisphaerae bacterium]|nr:nicotinate (nicotinamide) nucleotide adenylyltransferase [Phycisphaerae bacterium]MDD5380992.1 nicotinate (nicotinamide) nucleotide adenylyltransferase [Phycisphaerae bacterium]